MYEILFRRIFEKKNVLFRFLTDVLFQLKSGRPVISCSDVNRILKAVAETAVQDNIKPLCDQMNEIRSQIDDLNKQNYGSTHWQLKEETLKLLSKGTLEPHKSELPEIRTSRKSERNFSFRMFAYIKPYN